MIAHGRELCPVKMGRDIWYAGCVSPQATPNPKYRFFYENRRGKFYVDIHTKGRSDSDMGFCRLAMLHSVSNGLDGMANIKKLHFTWNGVKYEAVKQERL